MEKFIQVRDAVAADAPAISRICGDGFSYVHASGFNADDLEAMRGELYSPEAIREDLARTDRYYLVLADGDEVVGCIRMAPPSLHDAKLDKAGIELSRFYLEANYRSGGWGAKMMARANQRARSMGFERCWLHVFIPNYRAQDFYLRNGYEFRGQESLHYRNSHPTGFVMVKDLRRELCPAAPLPVL